MPRKTSKNTGSRSASRRNGASVKTRAAVKRVAHDVFGFDHLRDGQESAIKSVLNGHDTLAVMPTGSGKSAIYQLSALTLDGPTVVISPLIALQRDQVDALQEVSEAGAAVLNSTLSAAEREDTLAAFREGRLEFLFLAPEQLNHDDITGTLHAAGVSLFVVDEAHCVSEWGFDFRPEYLRVGAALQALADSEHGRPVALALTATASPPVRAEIIERLGLRDPHLIVRGFDRPNIDLGVHRHEQDDARQEAVLEYVRQAPKPGIVYAPTRRSAQDLAAALQADGVVATHYHAGMKATSRDEVQTSFMADEWDVIVATTAFGMGIDKPDVRFVVHLGLPGSLDSYYQEIGRAGRDGDPAEARLHWSTGDLGLRKFLGSGVPVEADEVELVLRLLQVAGEPVDAADLEGESGLTKTKLLAVITRLEDLGAVRMHPGGEIEAVREGTDEPTGEVAEEAARAHEHRREYERSRLNMMRGYAETNGCRREYLLNYFGEAFEPPCGHCDNCRAGLVHPHTEDEGPFEVGTRVRHASFGDGQVMRVEAGKVTVLFDERGYQTLALDVVLENELLREVSLGEPGA